MIKCSEKVVYLDITTWQGSSVGAVHWYGELKQKGQRPITLEAPLSTSHATYVNKQAQRRGLGIPYEPGDMYSGFMEREHVIGLARACWKIVYPDAVLLLEGRTGIVEPMPILEAPETWDVAGLNELWALCEELGWWNGGNERKVQLASEGWFRQVNDLLQAT